jgi:hypothetical protein
MNGNMNGNVDENTGENTGGGSVCRERVSTDSGTFSPPLVDNEAISDYFKRETPSR